MCGGEMEVGQCPVCKKENVPLMRKYFHYDLGGLQCECHSPSHFEIAFHCKDCEPKEPRETKVILSTKNLKKIEE